MQQEVPRYPGRAREHTDGGKHQCHARLAERDAAASLHVEDPRQRHHHRKSERQDDHHIAEHRVRPAEAVHDRLDDLQDGERGDPIPDQRAKHPPPLQLCYQRHRRPRLRRLALPPHVREHGVRSSDRFVPVENADAPELLDHGQTERDSVERVNAVR